MSFSNFFARHAAVVAFAMSCLAVPTAGASVVLHVDSHGILTGASGVTVGLLPDTYSVKFVDGTCAAVFGACDVAHFTFGSSSDALNAAQALLDVVLLDGLLGNFDSVVTLQAGCSDIRSCSTLTPYGLGTSDFGPTVQVANSNNRRFVSGIDGAIQQNVLASNDTSARANVWAVWIKGDFPGAENPASAPEPGTLALLGLAGAALAWTQRRRRAATQAQ